VVGGTGVEPDRLWVVPFDVGSAKLSGVGLGHLKSELVSCGNVCAFVDAEAECQLVLLDSSQLQEPQVEANQSRITVDEYDAA